MAFFSHHLFRNIPASDTSEYSFKFQVGVESISAQLKGSEDEGFTKSWAVFLHNGTDWIEQDISYIENYDIKVYSFNPTGTTTDDKMFFTPGLSNYTTQSGSTKIYDSSTDGYEMTINMSAGTTYQLIFKANTTIIQDSMIRFQCETDGIGVETGTPYWMYFTLPSNK